ncbi:hypothetical protein [Amycolatopsis sp. DG1A-15b]|uniref:hypothetical protein n=1 Tax=Amycolatopsis sp. DG1A-15b TaxID=3052846 RepID=UPI00255B8E05|nr:hypothetical protein [Amycolatopsis sp. DG1A-15b]WIX89289.1 hypothetical protein QRY02_02225 [Amycolatopsis sp. DG1A-15b]
MLSLSKDALPAWVRSGRRRFRIDHGTVVVASTLAFVLGIFRPDPLANLLLLTCSGSVRPAPVPVPTGLVAGELVVLWLTFVDTHLAGTVTVGSAAVVAPRRTSLVEAA